MRNYKFTFIDEMRIKPIKEYVVTCDIDKSEVEDVVALLNATQWRTIVDLNSVMKNIKGLSKCTQRKEKHIVLGGFSGGPTGRRSYTFPVIYEKPSNSDILEIDANIECKQEGSHLLCSLNPKIL